MAGEALQKVRLRDDFYRDGFYKVFIAFVLVCVAIACLVVLSLWFALSKPRSVNFSSDNEWRILPPVPVDQPYLTTADLLQWASQALPAVFTYDFVNYSTQLKNAEQYFTPNGWNRFGAQLNVYANYNTIKNGKLFVSATPGGAPIILNQGLLEQKYGWWVQMPLDISYGSVEKGGAQTILIQALVIRVSTFSNLNGVAIDNIVIGNKG